MVTTVNDDRVVENTAEVLTGWLALTLGGNVAAESVDAIHAQGTSSIAVKVSGTGFGGIVNDVGVATDITDDHIFIWGFTMQTYQVDASDGVAISISSAADGTVNNARWRVGGLDTNIGNKSNFQSWCIDVHQPFVFTNGTPPALNNIRSIALLWDFTSSNGRISAFVDQISRGAGITLTAGTVGVPGNSVDVAANDSTNGRGMFQDIGGLYYILGGVVIGDTANSSVSHFTDIGKVWNFEGQHVSATFHKISFVGSADGLGTNTVTFGSEIGTGITASGSGGNVFQSGGASPFRIEAIDSNVTVHLFGCNMIGPIALQNDPWRSIQNGTVSDITRAANSSTGSLVFPATQALNDALYFGHKEPFNAVKNNVTIAKAGTWAITWEYWNGTAWAALTNVTDGTNSFATTGINSVDFSIPDDWATTAVNSRTFYYTRARISAFTSTGAQPTIVSSQCTIGGRVRWEQVNAKAVSGTWSNMDTVVVRNGAILRKVTIADSVAPAKSAALDLGSSDPAADTIRDLTIINCNKGILLKGTATGTTTYNLRNIKYGGNVKDIRVDFPAAATVVINILEGGDTPTIDNVNTSTITVENPVTTTITVKDVNTQVAIQNARVYLETAAGGPLAVGTVIFNELTNVSGQVIDIRTLASNQPITGRVRLGSTPPFYKTGVINGTISSATGFSTLVQLVRDD